MAKKKLSEAERKKIQAQINDLQSALEEQEEAEGAEESAEAAEAVEEEREQLASLFDRLGIGEEDWELLSTAFATGTEEQTRKIVREELAAEEEAAEPGTVAELEETPDAGAVPEGKPENDKPPSSKHWTERRIFGGRDDEPEEES